MEISWTPGGYISIIYRKCQLYLDRTLAESGLGKGLYLCLLEISRGEGLNQKNLAEKIVLDQASVTRCIKKLVDKGLARREYDAKDGRAHNIFLTEKGREALEKVKLHLDQWDEIAIKDFSEKERKLLTELLNKMVSNVNRLSV